MRDKNAGIVRKIRKGIDVNDNYYELYLRNYGLISRYVYKFVKRPADLDDLYQLGFFAVMDAVDSFDLEGTYFFSTVLKTWLIHHFYEFNCTYHCAMTMPHRTYSKIIKYQEPAPVFVSIDTVADPIFSVDLNLAQAEDKLLWDQLKIMLPEKYYDVLWKSIVEEKSNAEIGRELNLCRERVRVLRNKILQEVRKAL